MTANRSATRSATPGAPGVLLGMGLAGLVDGIVMHQTLQWHHLLSSREPAGTLAGLRANTLADGLFHLASLGILLIGLSLVLARWRAGRPSGTARQQAGAILTGFGLFNVLDGTVNHWLLGLHHVRDDLGSPLSWDVGFLVASVLLTGLGWWLARERAPERR